MRQSIQLVSLKRAFKVATSLSITNGECIAKVINYSTYGL